MIDDDLEPNIPLPSFKDDVLTERKHRSKPRKKISWNWKIWESKDKPLKAKKVAKQAKVQRKPMSISKPVLMALLTFLIMILGLLAPATIVLAKAMDSLGSSAENILRRLGNGNNSEDNTPRTS